VRVRDYQLEFEPRSAPPENPQEYEVYLDDGTNTESGKPSLRQWDGTGWVDLGLQTLDDVAIDGGPWT